jgi:hypothetical protein
MPSLSHEELLAALVGEITAATDRFGAGECLEEDLPTAPILAHRVNERLETVKKKLRLLKAHDVIQVVGMTPKRYRLNRWAAKSLDTDHPLHFLFEEAVEPLSTRSDFPD